MNNSNVSQLNLFISTSITQKIGKPQEIAKLKALVETIDQTACNRGAITTCAFRAEKWKGEEKPETFIPRDMKWCAECDGAILIPEDSGGVLVEQGWLSLLKKPMLRLYENAMVHMSDLVKNLHVCAPVFDYVFNTPEEIMRRVNEFIDFLEQTVRKS